jgi:hypothetical protein
MAAILGDRSAIYSCALVQGAVAVIFSAYTAIFIVEYHYDLTLPQYGALFIPQVCAAIAAPLFSAAAGFRLRAKRAYRTGLVCSLIGLAMLVATQWAKRLPVSYPLLLTGTVFVGAGFGLTVPFLRSYAVSFKPLSARRQILLINALAAAGMAIAPLYVLATRTTDVWWTLPLLLGILIIAELLLSRSLRAPPDGTPARGRGRRIPPRFRAYPALALLYGICAIICVTGPHLLAGSSSNPRMSFLVLAEVGFWAALVAGFRVVFALIDGMRTRRRAASISVFVTALLLAALSAAISRYDLMHFGIYLLAAIGCAALLPIDTRPGHENLAQLPLAVTAGLMALFPVGLGLSQFGIDIAADNGVSALGVYLGVAVVGATSCILLLPIILRWRTMAYFDLPGAWGAARLSIGYSGATAIAGSWPATAPRRPRDPSEDGRRSREPGGATALPRSPRRESSRQRGERR